MKKTIRIIALLMLLSLALGYAVPARADYKWKVTISGGLYGTINGSKSVTVECDPTDPSTLTLDLGSYTPTVTNSKYYFKGWHLAGQDFGEDPLGASVEVTEDMTIVAAYGIRGEMATLTIHYVYKTNNNTAHTDVTYYGNKGDTVKVAAAYVSGYHPDKTTKDVRLSNDTNEITFYYTKTTVQTKTVTRTSSGVRRSGSYSRPSTSRSVLIDDMEVEDLDVDDGIDDIDDIDDPNAEDWTDDMDMEDGESEGFVPRSFGSLTDDMNGEWNGNSDSFQPYTLLEEEDEDFMDEDDFDELSAGPFSWLDRDGFDDSSDGGNNVWLAAGIGAVALLALIAAIAFLILRRRNAVNRNSEEQ